MERLCPECNNPLEATDFAGNEVAVCTDCKGIWFHQGELKRIYAAHVDALEQLEEQADRIGAAQPVEGQRAMNCPDCRMRLIEYRYALDKTVNLAVCPSCQGMWIEHGELKRIARSYPSPVASPVEISHATGSRTVAPPIPAQGYAPPADSARTGPPDAGVPTPVAPIEDVPPQHSQPLVPVYNMDGQIELVPANLANPQTPAEREARAIVDSMDVQTQANQYTARVMWAVAGHYGRRGIIGSMFNGFGW